MRNNLERIEHLRESVSNLKQENERLRSQNLVLIQTITEINKVTKNVQNLTNNDSLELKAIVSDETKYKK